MGKVSRIYDGHVVGVLSLLLFTHDNVSSNGDSGAVYSDDEDYSDFTSIAIQLVIVLSTTDITNADLFRNSLFFVSL